MNEVCYLDWNSTTPLQLEAAEAMRRVDAEGFGNPASAHAVGRAARRFLEDAREQVAEMLGCIASEVTFTSGATESNNLAVFGACDGLPVGSRLLATETEHPCIVEPLKLLEKRGKVWERLPVSPQGQVNPDDIATRVSSETKFLALMLVNHETGVFQRVGHVARHFASQVHIHCDAAQAVGKITLNMKSLGVHTLTASGHKFGGPKGVGLLLVRSGVTLSPRVWGGHQQQGRRPGTESPALAVGLATALRVSLAEAKEHSPRLIEARLAFLAELQMLAAPVVVNGHFTESLATTLNLSFPGCRADILLMKLDLAGIACSTGSACSSGSLTPSSVLQAMGLSEELLRSALRFSFSVASTKESLVAAARRIAAVVQSSRQVPT